MQPVRPRPLLLLISAPSGGGKTTVCQRLLVSDPGFTRVVTCTTRPPREGEQAGVDYHFVAPDEFKARVAAGEFLEHATVYDHYYGTLRQEVLARLDTERDVLLNVDVQGAASIRAAAQADSVLREALVTVFLVPPTLAVLEERLRRRDTDSEEAVRRRLARARTEVAESPKFDYLVISSTIAEDLRRMQVIVEAERMRTRRAAAPAF